jgi:serine/threonine protein phosphatase PrpC
MSALLAGERPRTRAPHLGAFKFLSVAMTHEGCVRALNEDALLNRPDVGLWAVADGMGGHESGEVASALVVEALAEVENFRSAYSFRDAACSALRDANDALRQQARERLTGIMGATVVALLAHHGHYACLWAGDSRCYLYRGGALRRLTRDHSVVQDLIDSGALSPQQAKSDARGHVITRAVGAAAELDIEGAYGPILPGDRFLLCSDGITGVVTDGEIAELLARPPLEAAAQRLLNRALSRGAPDNLTCVLVAAEAA